MSNVPHNRDTALGQLTLELGLAVQDQRPNRVFEEAARALRGELVENPYVYFDGPRPAQSIPEVAISDKGHIAYLAVSKDVHTRRAVYNGIMTGGTDQPMLNVAGVKVEGLRFPPGSRDPMCFLTRDDPAGPPFTHLRWGEWETAVWYGAKNNPYCVVCQEEGLDRQVAYLRSDDSLVIEEPGKRSDPTILVRAMKKHGPLGVFGFADGYLIYGRTLSERSIEFFWKDKTLRLDSPGLVLKNTVHVYEGELGVCTQTGPKTIDCWANGGRTFLPPGTEILVDNRGTVYRTDRVERVPGWIEIRELYSDRPLCLYEGDYPTAIYAGKKGFAIVAARGASTQQKLRLSTRTTDGSPAKIKPNRERLVTAVSVTGSQVVYQEQGLYHTTISAYDTDEDLMTLENEPDFGVLPTLTHVPAMRALLGWRTNGNRLTILRYLLRYPIR